MPRNGSDGPGVWFPPPLVYLILIGIALWIERRYLPVGVGSGLPGGRRVATVAGGCLLGLGLSLDLWSLARFRRARTSPLPFRPASAFVAVGPYRFTRNPMYLGMTLVVVALGLLLDSVWVALSGPIGAALIHTFVIPREERYLERRFGASFLDYKRQVRRWI